MFAKLLQLLVLLSGCDEGDDGGFKRRRDDYHPGIMLLLHLPPCDGGQPLQCLLIC